MTINQLKRAIKAAEQARSNWNGIGTIPVSYDDLCSLRDQLTHALIEADSVKQQEEQKKAEDKRFWDGIWSRIEI